MHSRRQFLQGSVAAAVAAALGGQVALAGNAAAPRSGATVDIEVFTAPGRSAGVVPTPRVVRSEAEWRKQLSAESFIVARQEGTEQPYTGKYWNDHSPGIYRCICCDTALFDAATKFDSGTGWPSFWQPISRHNVVENTDTSYGMVRTAVACALCNAHLGHVFDDGPKPTGLRYCMNSVSLRLAA